MMGQSHVHGQGQGDLVFCREGRQQLGHPVPAVAFLIVEQRAAGVGDGYQGGPPVSGVLRPGSRDPAVPAAEPVRSSPAGRCSPRRPTRSPRAGPLPIKRAQRQVGSPDPVLCEGLSAETMRIARLFKPLDSDLSADAAV